MSVLGLRAARRAAAIMSSGAEPLVNVRVCHARSARVSFSLTKRSVSLQGNKRTRHFSRLTVSRMCRLKSAESIAHNGAILRNGEDGDGVLRGIKRALLGGAAAIRSAVGIHSSFLSPKHNA